MLSQMMPAINMFAQTGRCGVDQGAFLFVGFIQRGRLKVPLTQRYPDSAKADPQIDADIVKPFLNKVSSFPASTMRHTAPCQCQRR